MYLESILGLFACDLCGGVSSLNKNVKAPPKFELRAEFGPEWVVAECEPPPECLRLYSEAHGGEESVLPHFYTDTHSLSEMALKVFTLHLI